MRVLGVDIGGSSVKAMVLDDWLRDVARAASDRYSRPKRRELLAAMRQAVERLGLGPGAWDATAVCAPGQRDGFGTVVKCINLPGLVNTSPETLLDEVAPTARASRVRLDAFQGAEIEFPLLLRSPISDAHAAGYDIQPLLTVERTFAPCGGLRMGMRRPRLLAISIGTGVGACVLNGFEPLRVVGMSSGRFGQMDVSVPLEDGSIPVGPDGGRGGLEAYLGAPALLARLGPPAESIVDRLEADDPEITALVRAIRIGHAIYGPDAVALLGGTGIRLKRLGAQIKRAVKDQLTSVATPGWSLVFGRDDYHAARGVARMVIMDAWGERFRREQEFEPLADGVSLHRLASVAAKRARPERRA
jgi:predicted NBD/HSP70 family sugar kinase